MEVPLASNSLEDDADCIKVPDCSGLEANVGCPEVPYCVVATEVVGKDGTFEDCAKLSCGEEIGAPGELVCPEAW